MKYLYSLLLALLVPLLARAECDTLFYMHRLRLPDSSGAFRLMCLDSLLSAKRGGIDSLLIAKGRIAYDLGMFGVVTQTYEQLSRDYPRTRALSLADRLELQLHYIHSLRYTKRYKECIDECTSMLGVAKPDSLRYYDTFVDCVLVGFNNRTSMVHSQKYVDRNEALLRRAEGGNWPRQTVDNIKYGCCLMLIQNACRANDYEKALMYADYIVPLHITKTQRNGLDTNIAYIYLRLGKHEEAEECFRRLLDDGEPTFNKGVTLLNYTHLLNLQGRYSETLDVLDKYDDVARCLDQDMYSSYLLANRAMAESEVLGYDKAFGTLLRSKELGDSIAYGSGIQDGLLMLDYSEQSAQLAGLERDVRDRDRWLWIGLGVIGLLAASGVWLMVLLRRRKRENEDLAALLAASRERCGEAERSFAELTQIGDSKVAAQLLQVAAVEDTLDRIEEVVRVKDEDADEKLKQIAGLVSSSEAKRDGRERFEHHFEQAHAGFFKRLYEVHANLTPGEVRMCAYVVMNLSNKEIATLTNKSVRSVESSRYRIGKKLEVQDGESLVSYLRRFLQ